MPGFLASSRAGFRAAETARERDDAQHLGMVDQRIEQAGLCRDRQLEHHLLAVGNLVQLFENRGRAADRRSAARSALLMFTSGSMIGIMPCASTCLRDLELLRDQRPRSPPGWRG